MVLATRVVLATAPQPSGQKIMGRSSRIQRMLSPRRSASEVEVDVGGPPPPPQEEDQRPPQAQALGVVTSGNSTDNANSRTVHSKDQGAPLRHAPPFEEQSPSFAPSRQEASRQEKGGGSASSSFGQPPFAARSPVDSAASYGPASSSTTPAFPRKKTKREELFDDARRKQNRHKEMDLFVGGPESSPRGGILVALSERNEVKNSYSRIMESDDVSCLILVLCNKSCEK